MTYFTHLKQYTPPGCFKGFWCVVTPIHNTFGGRPYGNSRLQIHVRTRLTVGGRSAHNPLLIHNEPLTTSFLWVNNQSKQAHPVQGVLRERQTRREAGLD